MVLTRPTGRRAAALAAAALLAPALLLVPGAVTSAQAADAPTTTLFFHSASGSYAQDAAADPSAATAGRAPAGATLTATPGTRATAATASYAAGVAEGSAGLPTFSEPVAGTVTGVCLDLWVQTDSAAADGQIDTRSMFYSSTGTATANSVLTALPYTGGILHLRGLVKPPANSTVAAGSAFAVATYVNTNAGWTMSYDSASMPSSITLNPTSCSGLPSAGGVTPTVPVTPAPDNGLSFGASVTADPQRSESEPNMEIDAAGNIYTCGPTGFSNASDYAQVSTDGGDQFHLIGAAPRGQQGSGGGGDCGLATATERNAQGKYTYAYTGLGPLTGFTTSTSDDYGQTLLTAGPQGNGSSAQGLLTDRQWMVFTGPKTVLLSYNQQDPRNVVVQPSTDGGLTYGPGVLAAPNPLFPGPMRSLPKELNPKKNGKPLVYFPWNAGNNANLSISQDGGTTWTDCLVAVAPGTPSAGFMTADNDLAGNLYFAYADKTTFNTYLTTLPHDRIAGCDNPVGTLAAPGTQPTNNPGWSAPVIVNHDGVARTVFPWLVAGGAPGRVAVAYYGTPSAGDPNLGTFKATWDVYVDQSLNALDGPAMTMSQVKATTHPLHYDSVCLNGLGCSISTPAGDRSLGDFFALDYSPVSGKLSIVYDQSSKKPGEAAGRLATPAALTQNGGPSNSGTDFGVPTRAALRQSSTDPSGDAIAGYSGLVVTPTRSSESGADFTSVKVDRQRDLATGALVPDGGFTVTMTVASLAPAALQKAMTDTASLSLLYSFRFVNGFTASAATAYYTPAGWTFGFNDYTTGTCGGGSCQQYPGGTVIPGRVDPTTGTITLSVPRANLRMLSGPTGDGQRPVEGPATDTARFFDGTAFSYGNAQAVQASQSYLTTLDATAGMDFLLAPPTDPTAVVPEAPVAVLLPLLGLGLAVMVVRRRRAA